MSQVRLDEVSLILAAVEERVQILEAKDVIDAPCSGCAALLERVARLEGVSPIAPADPAEDDPSVAFTPHVESEQ